MNYILENYLRQVEQEPIVIDFMSMPDDEENDLELDELLHESEWLDDDTFTFEH